MDKYIEQLHEMYNNGEISLKEESKLIDEYQKSGKTDSQILSKIPESIKVEVIEDKISEKKEISDREIQEQILETLKLNHADNRTIKSWVVFFELALYYWISNIYFYYTNCIRLKKEPKVTQATILIT